VLRLAAGVLAGHGSAAADELFLNAEKSFSATVA